MPASTSNRPLWLDDVELPRFAPLEEDIHVDVCVVGAGIAGLSTAYALARDGLSVMVLDDGEIGGGETSRTTAHLSNAFDDRYHLVERMHGEQGARLVADSHTAAIDAIERIVAEERIDCAFERVDGYLVVPPGDPHDELERELEACHRAGLTDVRRVDRAPLEAFETGLALRFPRQAQFHPMRYLAALARAIVRDHGRIATHTRVTAIETGHDGASAHVRVGDNGPTVTASDVVVATNTPVNDLITMHTKQYAYRTYVMALRVPRGAMPPLLLWDTPHPYHYARLARGTDGDHLVVGGEDHKTGQEDDDARDRFHRLETWARERFPAAAEVTHRWSGQVMEPADTLAFIGKNPGKDENVWIVTGDSGNGMTHGTIAALLLPDLIRGRENPWATVYDPARKSLRAAWDFTVENLNMLTQYTSWVTGGEVKDESEIPPGSGAVIRKGLRKVAVYRAPDGTLHACSAACTHLGAIVTWNAQAGTWDCPAHGSRFAPDGHVVNGPAVKDLAPETIENGGSKAASGDEERRSSER